MRVPATLFSFLILATSLCAQSVTVSERDDYKRPWVTTPPANTVTAGRFSFAPTPVIRRHTKGVGTCYTLHVLYAEKRPNTDETQIVRQRTCTPSTQFETKSTILQTK